MTPHASRPMTWTNLVPIALLALGLSLLGTVVPAHAAGPECPSGHGQGMCAHAMPAKDREATLGKLAELIFPTLPPEEQAKIRAVGGIGSGAPCATGDAPAPGEKTAWLESRLENWEGEPLEPRKIRALRSIARSVDAGTHVPQFCFAPGSDPEYVQVVSDLLYEPNPIAFQQVNRWTFTSLTGPGLLQGDPTAFTYSYVPDGTVIPGDLTGLPTGNSILFIWLDSIYGTPSVWQPLFDQVFDRWAELTGTSYQYEPNDDGVVIDPGNIGVSGVRGDIRIAAFPVDGNSGILAFNFFPDFGGDMVFDAFDNFYADTSNNSLRFRNVTSHEHGHGLGMGHVCPFTFTILMEPFATTAFDGPQLDDILNGQRHYGDPLEPNDSATQTSPLGTLGVTDSVSQSNVSLDDDNDEDWYALTLSEPGTISVTVSPDAAAYFQGPQTQQCNEGDFTDYNEELDFRLALFDAADPGVPLEVVNLTALGEPETLEYASNSTGDFLIRLDGVTPGVFGPQIQRYLLELTVDEPPFLGPTIAASVPPESVDPGTTVVVGFSVDPRQDTLAQDPEVRVSIGGAPFAVIPSQDTGGGAYTATLPGAACDETIEYYIAVLGQETGLTLQPPMGGDDPFVIQIGTLEAQFTDNFQTDTGWSVEGDITQPNLGLWQRGVPQGDGSRGDPPQDADGSGQCFVTGNGAPGSNSDVDGGSTILVSPPYDLSGITRPFLSYARWYDNTGGGLGSGQSEDTLLVEVTDGSTDFDGELVWTTLEVVGPGTPDAMGGWFDVSFDLEDAIQTPLDLETTEFRVRFTASDIINTSVVEAGVDAIAVSGFECENPCRADLNDDGSVTFPDVSLFLTAFTNGELDADFNSDGQISFPDVSAFLNAFTQGCDDPA